MPAERKIKICLAGESKVGKSSLIRRYTTDQFYDQYLMTLGAAVCKKQVHATDPKTHKPVTSTFVIWDVMGNKDLPELLTLAYFKGARGIILVCDITRRETYEKLQRWTGMIYEVVGTIPLVIVGNKWDLRDSATVSEEDLRAFATQHSGDYLMASARTGENVDTAFEMLLRRIAPMPEPAAATAG